MEYTFYGDLLGISGYYKLSPGTAREKLNQFYNTAFFSLSDYCRDNDTVQVMMFSDSLLLFGEDTLAALGELHKVYVKLIQKSLLLRGAIVKGRLSFEPRFTLDNYTKMLPENDMLARAVGLQSTKKGARLLIENQLAEELLANYPEWLTHEGYIRYVEDNNYAVPYESILRRICPTPDQDTYECLYFWTYNGDLEHQELDYREVQEELSQINSMLKDSISIHYRETIGLLKRCQNRQRFTMERMLSNRS